MAATSQITASTIEAVKEKARRLSVYSMMATTAAGSGHPTSCMSAAELVAGVFFHAMKFRRILAADVVGRGARKI